MGTERYGISPERTTKSRETNIPLPDFKVIEHRKSAIPPKVVQFETREEYGKAISFILKSPACFYSMYGFEIFDDYKSGYGVNRFESRCLLIISHHSIFYSKDFKYWLMNPMVARRVLNRLIVKSFVVPALVPSPFGKGKKRHGYMLAPLGQSFVNNYEEFFEKRMDMIREQLKVSDVYDRRTDTWQRRDRLERKLNEQIWNDLILSRKTKK